MAPYGGKHLRHREELPPMREKPSSEAYESSCSFPRHRTVAFGGYRHPWSANDNEAEDGVYARDNGPIHKADASCAPADHYGTERCQCVRQALGF